ncbi:hypothetical protein PIROE2DRAFT_56966 [Piromyces sp. E2]|nr:hypothetical protein PIROE2DRAFT_56966 [Piromyces sp. E2]|eukprot:OUM70065.1 hypothetical protein PIROE2DRAFT_56966 [Piromyces sp. E2]
MNLQLLALLILNIKLIKCIYLEANFTIDFFKNFETQYCNSNNDCPSYSNGCKFFKNIGYCDYSYYCPENKNKSIPNGKCVINRNTIKNIPENFVQSDILTISQCNKDTANKYSCISNQDVFCSKNSDCFSGNCVEGKCLNSNDFTIKLCDTSDVSMQGNKLIINYNCKKIDHEYCDDKLNCDSECYCGSSVDGFCIPERTYSEKFYSYLTTNYTLDFFKNLNPQLCYTDEDCPHYSSGCFIDQIVFKNKTIEGKDINDYDRDYLIKNNIQGVCNYYYYCTENSNKSIPNGNCVVQYNKNSNNNDVKTRIYDTSNESGYPMKESFSISDIYHVNGCNKDSSCNNEFICSNNSNCYSNNCEKNQCFVSTDHYVNLCKIRLEISPENQQVFYKG